jgi:tetratricopeptide (TPR) repeat protein
MGDYHKARELMRTAQKLIEECGDQRMVAVSLYHRSGVEFDLGEFDSAREMLEQSLKISTAVGDRWTMGTSRLQLGLIAQVQGEHEQAIHWFREAQEFCQETGEHLSKVRTLNGLGTSMLALDNDDEAGRVFREALAAAVEAELWPFALDVLVGFSTWQMKRGAPEAALVTLEQVTRHPACSQNTSERVSCLRMELEAQLTPTQIEAIQAHAGEKTFEAVVAEVLKQTELT